jgi:hypothetical protein
MIEVPVLSDDSVPIVCWEVTTTGDADSQKPHTPQMSVTRASITMESSSSRKEKLEI